MIGVFYENDPLSAFPLIVRRFLMKKKRYEAAVEAYNQVGDETDVLGSYTGIYRSNSGELAVGIYPPCGETLSGKPIEDPVQDADDL